MSGWPGAQPAPRGAAWHQPVLSTGRACPHVVHAFGRQADGCIDAARGGHPGGGRGRIASRKRGQSGGAKTGVVLQDRRPRGSQYSGRYRDRQEAFSTTSGSSSEVHMKVSLCIARTSDRSQGSCGASESRGRRARPFRRNCHHKGGILARTPDCGGHTTGHGPAPAPPPAPPRPRDPLTTPPPRPP